MNEVLELSWFSVIKVCMSELMTMLNSAFDDGFPRVPYEETLCALLFLMKLYFE